jgi:hypothetical protein
MSINIGKMMDYIADKLGVPAVIRVGEEERDMIKQQAAQQISQFATQNPEMAAQMAPQVMQKVM